MSAAILRWYRGDDERVFEIPPDGATIGREDGAEIVIDETLVSRSHARIERCGDRWVVRDLGSTNLTRVNGVVVGECVLDHGDEIRFSRARCVFEIQGTAANPSADPPPDAHKAPIDSPGTG